MRFPISDVGAELAMLALLALIAIGDLVLLGIIAVRGVQGWDVAACLLVLQSIISTIKERWQQHSIDRMGQSLANSPPTAPRA